MPKAYFVKLQRPERARHLCELAERFYLQGYRVLVTVMDENQGVTLDRFMWSWQKGSFVPHAYDNGAVECHAEPVVIGSCEQNPNSAQVLIMGGHCSLEFMRRFEIVIDFAEVYDPGAAAQSRQRFSRYREAGFAPEMLQ
ncbi:DNA polymerase III subunit chi [Geothermobacter hydrogeniphilus]|uniref:DNA polymerase III subunit chi n=1 Tax=Geothermobacter hydrogeniphilus TaxID=1969733 RepID=A0A2K2HD26_9BACT|nr:DNA polymerase III subunit chi [Geothermobacter hydrogeniphilus]PNU21198.1 DNA polymerase III subunit chi [Geothermobacter hydrogeniphilus]